MYTTLNTPNYTSYIIHYLTGIITIKDLADSSFSIMDLGGKKGFIQNVTNRKGVPEGWYICVYVYVIVKV